MNFDSKAFQKSQFEPRTREVTVKSLSEFFAEGANPVFVVRSLEHAEISRVRECNSRDALVKSAISALAGSDAEKGKAIHEILGDIDDVPERTRVRIEAVKIACVDPVIDQTFAVRLAQFFPNVLETLSDAIFELTDEGAVIAKKKR